MPATQRMNERINYANIYDSKMQWNQISYAVCSLNSRCCAFRSLPWLQIAVIYTLHVSGWWPVPLWTFTYISCTNCKYIIILYCRQCTMHIDQYTTICKRSRNFVAFANSLRLTPISSTYTFDRIHPYNDANALTFDRLPEPDEHCTYYYLSFCKSTKMNSAHTVAFGMETKRRCE